MSDEPGFVDGIPVEELVRLTREFTARITNEDRQRLALELNEGGRPTHTATPYLLNQFFAGKISLDYELSRRFPNAPLLSSASFAPTPGKRARAGWGQLKSQDEAATLTMDVHGTDGSFEASFGLGSMVGVTFEMGPVADVQRLRFLDQLRRSNGISILWTRERWERDYMIFVVRERFARLYAFGGRFEAACRLSPDVLEQLVAWLTGLWTAEDMSARLEG
jgi:hypothetical protein